MLISYFLLGDGSALWDCQANSVDLKEKAIHITPI